MSLILSILQMILGSILRSRALSSSLSSSFLKCRTLSTDTITFKPPLLPSDKPRDAPKLDHFTLVDIKDVNALTKRVGLLMSEPRQGEPIKYAPGHQLDVYCPDILQPGRYTVASISINRPSTEHPPWMNLHPMKPSIQPSIQHPGTYLELTIPKWPEDPPTAYLWRLPNQILKTNLGISLRSTYLWPSKIPTGGIKRILYVIGGPYKCFSSPLMCLLRLFTQLKTARVDLNIKTTVLYYVFRKETRNEKRLLAELAKVLGENGKVSMFSWENYNVRMGSPVVNGVEVVRRDSRGSPARITLSIHEVREAVGPFEERSKTVCYVYGLERWVSQIEKCEGLLRENVFFEGDVRDQYARYRKGRRDDQLKYVQLEYREMDL